MEIKVGEYVRLARRQGINKIIEIDEDYYVLDSEIADEWGDITDFIKEEKLQEEILKHSKNIIDLIEVGDYVNGYKVLDIMENLQTGEINCEMGNDCPTPDFDGQLYNKDIKTILTHEQYEQNCYRLEENNG